MSMSVKLMLRLLFVTQFRAYNRLLLPAPENMDLNDPKAPTCEYRPRQVQLATFKNTKIASFAFCKYSSAVLVLSTAMKVMHTYIHTETHIFLHIFLYMWSKL